MMHGSAAGIGPGSVRRVNEEGALEPHDRRRAVLTFNAAINARDVAALDRLMTDDHALIDSAGRTIAGREEVLGAWRGFFDAYSDYRNIWSEVQPIGGVVIATGRSVCSTEPLLDGPAIWAAKTRGELVSEWRVYEDTPANRRRLGIVA
jgi:ketosteroid isomerase-like protein